MAGLLNNILPRESELQALLTAAGSLDSLDEEVLRFNAARTNVEVDDLFWSKTEAQVQQCGYDVLSHFGNAKTHAL